MKTYSRLSFLALTLAFTVAFAAGCSLFGGSLSGIEKEIKNKGSAVSVVKSGLAKDIDTNKYGKFHFNSDQLKQVKGLAKKERTVFYDIKAKKIAKKSEKTVTTDILVLVIRTGSEKYQMFFMEKPLGL